MRYREITHRSNWLGHTWLSALLGLFLFGSSLFAAPEQTLAPRTEYDLNQGWRSLRVDAPEREDKAFISGSLVDESWAKVDVPHNWESYEGARLQRHGNAHGTAWYRRQLEIPESEKGRRLFLFFEGVGSKATVWLNGEKVGSHAGGLTTFTLDITSMARPGPDNLLVVKAEHPPGLRDLPWVCGGCERAAGFSEGPQPFGIFRPVRLICTDSLRIEPFGIHVWNDAQTNAELGVARVRSSIRNHGDSPKRFTLTTKLLDSENKVVASASLEAELPAGQGIELGPQELSVKNPSLWNVGAPKLYTLESSLLDSAGRTLDRLRTEFGFRTVNWPIGENASRGTLLINGAPVFLDGTCEYSHLLGASHAFGPEQIASRVAQIRAAGFNAFRDAHHPHDLRYNEAWDREGLAWWTQFGAHIWFDNDEFRTNFLNLLRDWVRERRNSPSLILWGLQNESLLPESFARECSDLIRSLDPTCGSQRLVTTCNGGKGTDWDVPQNWTGTYGGDPATYGEDLKRQLLVGEYGAWRSLGLHSEAPHPTETGYSEEHMTELLETKVRLANTVRDRSIGHFQWIFVTHENPGRNLGAKGEQGADGWEGLDRIGPANNKGLFTLWGEPLDAYAMYRSHQMPASLEPFVQIAGSTWPERFASAPGPRRITVYSNCDEVELFNDIDGSSLGVRKRGPFGTPFVWEDLNPMYRVLRAVGRVNGTDRVSDEYQLLGLPSAPNEASRLATQPDTTAPTQGWRYLYRVNCGGPSVVDSHGTEWSADQVWRQGTRWGSQSWAGDYPHMNPLQASARRISTVVTGTQDPSLYQSFRYGRERLKYVFQVPEGPARLELHFAEPWYGRGGTPAKDWRLFDVAVNGKTLIKDLDLFAEAGFGRALTRVLEVEPKDGRIELSFPRVAANQAILCAVAVATRSEGLVSSSGSAPIAGGFPSGSTDRIEGWLGTGLPLFKDSALTLMEIPWRLTGLSWLQRSGDGALEFTLREPAELYLALREGGTPPPAPWEALDEVLLVAEAGRTERLPLFRSHHPANTRINLPAEIRAASVVFLPLRPAAPAQALRDLRVAGSSRPGLWRISGQLREGTRPHGESAPSITRLPPEFGDADWLLTPRTEESRSLELRMLCTDSTEIIVGLDSSANEVPSWLGGWSDHPATPLLGETPLRLFRKRFLPGEVVQLGANVPGLPMYVVLGRLVRPAVSVPVSPEGGSVVLDTEHNSAEWSISVGVGDRYDLCFGYSSEVLSPLSVSMEVRDADGVLLGTRKGEVKPGTVTPLLRLRTPTSINAGSYRAKLILDTPGRLEINTLTVE